MDPLAGLLLGGLVAYALLKQDGAVEGSPLQDLLDRLLGRSGSTSSTNAAQAARSSATSQAKPNLQESDSTSKSAPSRTQAVKPQAPKESSQQKAAESYSVATQVTQAVAQVAQLAGALPAGTPIGAVANPLADAGFLATQAAGRTTQAAGQLVAQGRVNLIQPGYTEGQLGGALNPLFGKAGSALTSLGGQITQAGGLGAIGGSVIGTAAIAGFKNANEKQRKVILGQASVAGAQTALSAIPIFGAGLSALLGKGSQTYEGKRAVKAVGTAALQGYNFQKEILAGKISEAFGGGKRKERVAKLLSAAAASTPQSVQNSAKLRTQDTAARTLGLNAADEARSFVAAGGKDASKLSDAAKGFVSGFQVAQQNKGALELSQRMALERDRHLAEAKTAPLLSAQETAKNVANAQASLRNAFASSSTVGEGFFGPRKITRKGGF